MENVEKILDTMNSFGKINNEVLFEGIRKKCEVIFNTKDIKEIKYEQNGNITICNIKTIDNVFTITIQEGNYKLPGKNKTRGSKDKKKEAIDMYGTGLSQTLIGKSLGVSQKTISNWLKEDIAVVKDK